MFKRLMTARRFVPLFWCQFCSALNDNFLKNALGMLILFGFGTELAAQEPGRRPALLITLSGVVFIAPFFFLSALGGELADKYDKAHIAERIKFWRNPGRADRRRRLLPALDPDPVRGPARLRHRRRAVRPGEIRHPAGETDHRGTFDRQCARRGRDFHGHPARHASAAAIAVTQTKSPEMIVGIIVALAVACWLFAKADPDAWRRPHRASRSRAIRSTSTFAPARRAAHRHARLDVGGHITSWFWLVGVVAMSLLPVLVKDRLGGNEYRLLTGALMVFTHRHRHRLAAGGPRQP